MTAERYLFPHEFLAAIATSIINAVKGINRVVYDVTSKPAARSSGSRGLPARILAFEIQILDPHSMDLYQPILATSPSEAVSAMRDGAYFVIFNGDCRDVVRLVPDHSIDLFLTSPPYFMGKEYDRSYLLADFSTDVAALARDFVRVTAERGNLCWQVGYHVDNGTVFPLDFAVHEVMRGVPGIVLRNRIVWQFGHGTHAKRRFSGRHETVLWYGKGASSYFDLDAVRVPQKYPGKRHYKGPKRGEFSGNPRGKNPSDVWDIPNVKANHVEKTAHPCQFPVALAQRLIRALSPDNGIVFDPFSGSGTSGIAAVLEGRRYLGADTSAAYCQIACERYRELRKGELAYRPLEREIFRPTGKESVATKPAHFLT